MDEFKENDIKIDGLTEKEAKDFKALLSKFIKSYSAKDASVSDKDWLKNELKSELSDLSDEQADKMAQETLDSIAEYDKNLKELNENCKKGESKEQWFANKVAKASVGVSVIEYGNHLSEIDNALSEANAQMLDTITNKNGLINAGKNLDGFIAEQHHVNSFNVNAELNNSPYRAKVLKPSGHGYAKNSVDVEIYDTRTGDIVRRYQSKYYENANQTQRAFRKGGKEAYPFQQKLVPEGQSKDIVGKTTEYIEAPDGTRSNKLSKQDAELLRDKTQQSGEAQQIDWNTFDTKAMALNIGKQAGIAGLSAAAITTGFSLAEQVIKGEGIDADATVELALKTGADASVKAAAAGAIKVGAEKGILTIIPKGTPAGTIANIACVAIENVKIIGKVATGEFTMSQGLEHMGRTTVSMVYGLGWGAKGMAIGASALSWIPVAGPVVGGLVGGMVGYMAGSKFGTTIFNGLKKVTIGAGKALRSIGSKVVGGLKKIGKKIFG